MAGAPGAVEVLRQTYFPVRYMGAAVGRDLAEKSQGLLKRVDTAVDLQRQANRVLALILGSQYTLGRHFCSPACHESHECLFPNNTFLDSNVLLVLLYVVTGQIM
jgi:hypothetical protein